MSATQQDNEKKKVDLLSQPERLVVEELRERWLEPAPEFTRADVIMLLAIVDRFAPRP